MADWIWEGELDLVPAGDRIICIDGGVASEYEILNAAGEVIGYFAYGSYDPSLPYQGEELCSRN